MPGSFLENVGFTSPSDPNSFGSWLGDTMNTAWNGYQDLLNATSFGLHGKVTGALKDFFGDVGSYVNNALTGERDLQRQLDAEAREDARWQKRFDMTNDANVANWNRQYQASKRAVRDYAADLEAAGFNPALAATRGGSVSVPAMSAAPSYGGGSAKGTAYGNPAALSQIVKLAQSAVNVAGMLLVK